MKKLTPENLLPLERYARERDSFRDRVMAHKSLRRVSIGPSFTLYFEDRLTMQYQIQEMLRVERIFEPEGIAEELDTYNPLIPDGSNLKATAMFEFTDADERRQKLAQLAGVENRIWMQVEGHEKIPAIANEDLERSTADKTSAVHFLRFEFDEAAIQALRSGAGMSAGIDHDNYRHQTMLSPDSLAALVQDFA